MDASETAMAFLAEINADPRFFIFSSTKMRNCNIINIIFPRYIVLSDIVVNVISTSVKII